jgi:hypothetical protein
MRRVVFSGRVETCCLVCCDEGTVSFRDLHHDGCGDAGSREQGQGCSGRVYMQDVEDASQTMNGVSTGRVQVD